MSILHFLWKYKIGIPVAMLIGAGAFFSVTATQVVEPLSQPSNVSPIPGANVLISVIDEQGKPVGQGMIEVYVEFEDNLSHYDYSYSVNLVSIRDGLLGLHPPPSSDSATIFIQVVIPDGRTSDTLLFKNDEYWDAVAVTEQDFVASHEFVLGKSGTSLAQFEIEGEANGITLEEALELERRSSRPQDFREPASLGLLETAIISFQNLVYRFFTTLPKIIIAVLVITLIGGIGYGIWKLIKSLD